MIRAGVLLILLALSDPDRVRVEGPPGRVAWYEENVPRFLTEVEGALGARMPVLATVVLAPDDETFARETGGAPEWAAAVALPERATLVVRLSALGPERGTDAASVLRHEIVHLLLPHRIGFRAGVPRWFEEGLAQVIGGRLFPADMETLPLTAAAGRLIPLRDIADRFPREGGTAALAYAEGESAVRFLLDRKGPEGLTRLLDRVRETNAFEVAVDEIYGLSQGQLWLEWQEWIREEGSPWWLVILKVATIPFLLFVASLLAIGAWFRARRRGQRIYESLPE